jgi:hypothetical protein
LDSDEVDRGKKRVLTDEGMLTEPLQRGFFEDPKWHHVPFAAMPLKMIKRVGDPGVNLNAVCGSARHGEIQLLV